MTQSCGSADILEALDWLSLFDENYRVCNARHWVGYARDPAIVECGGIAKKVALPGVVGVLGVAGDRCAGHCGRT